MEEDKKPRRNRKNSSPKKKLSSQQPRGESSNSNSSSSSINEITCSDDEGFTIVNVPIDSKYSDDETCPPELLEALKLSPVKRKKKGTQASNLSPKKSKPVVGQKKLVANQNNSPCKCSAVAGQRNFAVDQSNLSPSKCRDVAGQRNFVPNQNNLSPSKGVKRKNTDMMQQEERDCVEVPPDVVELKPNSSNPFGTEQLIKGISIPEKPKNPMLPLTDKDMRDKDDNCSGTTTPSEEPGAEALPADQQSQPDDLDSEDSEITRYFSTTNQGVSQRSSSSDDLEVQRCLDNDNTTEINKIKRPPHPEPESDESYD